MRFGPRVALVTLALAATAAGAADITARYTCDDGSGLVATFVAAGNAPGSVVLQLAGGKTLSLPQTMSADGGRYAAGDTAFWSKGNGATFTYGGRDRTCQTNR